MKIPLSLIRSYIELDVPLSEICQALTLLGLEVEGIPRESAPFSHVVVGVVHSVAPHPTADKLQIAQVSDGAKEWQIVCAAKNCRKGLHVAFAKIGAILADERRIAETSIRGVPSHGMLCAASELGLAGDAEGILELPDDWKAGEDLARLIWDPVLEISLTPNLGYCMSALGVARELSAFFKKPLRHPSFSLKEHPGDRFSVSVQDAALCPRYMCRLIERVRIAPSPFWLQQLLHSVGLRPVCNAVDITNYILLKTGHPLHAFDADKLEGRKISVRTSAAPEKFLGLDGHERDIPPGTLLICDAKKTVALAGLMGGENSSVTDTTQTILLEAACFDPAVIRRASKRIGLRTDSSQRFEKGVDPQDVDAALNEASHWIAELCGGQMGKSVDVFHPAPPREIDFRIERSNRLLGTRISLGEAEEIFHRLLCKTRRKETNSLSVTIPSFRYDLVEEVGLIEEIARIYGYNHIEKKTALCTTSQLPNDPLYLFEREIRTRLAAQSLQEVLTCDLLSPRLAELAPEITARLPLQPVLHAKSEEYSILRPSLLPGLLEVVRSNLDLKNHNVSAFELGKIYFKQKDVPTETATLAFVFTGKNRPHHWDRKPEDVDFYDLKGIVETLFESLLLPTPLFHTSRHPTFHPFRQANIVVDDLTIGSFGEVHPAILAKLDIKQRTLFAELSLSPLLAHSQHVHRMAPIPSYPSTERDWTVALPEGMQIETLFRAIHSHREPLLEHAELIDLWKQNATFRFTYRDKLKTISFEEAEAAHARILAALQASI